MAEQYQNNIPGNNPIINGNSVDVQISSCDSEVKADIVVSEFQSIRMWGQIKTCNGKPIGNAMLKLVKEVYKPCGCEYVGIAHTVSDCNGFYQFDVCPSEAGSCFKIIVSKAAVGNERVICPQVEEGCSPCINTYNPCDRQEQCQKPCECYPNSTPYPCNNFSTGAPQMTCPNNYTQPGQQGNQYGCSTGECRTSKEQYDNMCRVNTYDCRSQS